MRMRILFALGLLCLPSIMLAAQGGFPSRPKLQTVTVTNSGGTAPAFLMSASTPVFRATSTTGALNEKHWQSYTTGSTWGWSALDDAKSVEKFFLQATRTGNVITAVNIGNATDNPAVNINGSPVSVGRIVRATVNSNCTLVAGSVGFAAGSSGGTGVCTNNFSVAYATAPQCTVTPTGSGSANVTTQAQTGTGQAVTATYTGSTGAAVAQQFHIICIGI